MASEKYIATLKALRHDIIIEGGILEIANPLSNVFQDRQFANTTTDDLLHMASDHANFGNVRQSGLFLRYVLWREGDTPEILDDISAIMEQASYRAGDNATKEGARRMRLIELLYETTADYYYRRTGEWQTLRQTRWSLQPQLPA